MGIWERIKDNSLGQGDRLNSIAVPLVRPSFPEAGVDGSVPIDVREMDVIVLTQSCDLLADKTPLVVVAEIHSLDVFEETNEAFKAKGKWTEVAKGRIEGLHLLHGHGEPNNGRECIIVDFRQIMTLPINYVGQFANNSGERWRLCSPYLEGMSQAFGRYFMRVALPVDLPRDFTKPSLELRGR
jgi:hypothetical protein